MVHYVDVNKTALTKLKNFSTINQCAKQWLPTKRKNERSIAEKRHKLWDLSVSGVDDKFGFHRKCYLCFANKTNIKRIK